MRLLVFTIGTVFLLLVRPLTVYGQGRSDERRSTKSRDERVDRDRDRNNRDIEYSRDRNDRRDPRRNESRRDRDDDYDRDDRYDDYDRDERDDDWWERRERRDRDDPYDYPRDDPYDYPRDDPYDYPRDDRYEYPDRRYRSVNVPPGHLPPPGECRVWYPDRPPGQQPPPEPCDRLRGYRGDGVIVSSSGRVRDYDDRYYDRRY